jgi:hypothetical protein
MPEGIIEPQGLAEMGKHRSPLVGHTYALILSALAG